MVGSLDEEIRAKSEVVEVVKKTEKWLGVWMRK